MCAYEKFGGGGVKLVKIIPFYGSGTMKSEITEDPGSSTSRTSHGHDT